MAGWTNRGKYDVVGHAIRGETFPVNGTQFRLVLTKTVAPIADTNTFSELTEITTGNGYSAGGVLISLNSTDFATWTEDDTGDLGEVILINKTYTNSGGTIPASGGGAEHAVLIDNHATPGSREVLFFGGFGGAQTTGTDQDFTVTNFKIQIAEA